MSLKIGIMRYTKGRLLIVAIIAANNCLGTGRPDYMKSKMKIDSFISRTMQEEKMVGLSLGVVRDGQVWYMKGYGVKKAGASDAVDSVTNFVTCSISKLFTATAIMQLVEQGKIDIHQLLSVYLPDFVMRDSRYRHITIEQMLTHTSGLPNVRGRHFIDPENDSVALTEFAKKLGRKKLAFEPGVALTAKTYSNTAYNILGLVIERVTGRTYSDYVEENVLERVGMRHSSFFYERIDQWRRSTPHIKRWMTGRVRTSGYYPDIAQDKPCGNLNSCAADLCKWMLHNLAIYNSTPIARPVLQRRTLQQMWTTTHKIAGYKTSIGLGWWLVDSEKYGQYLFHVGNVPGYSATLVVWSQLAILGPSSGWPTYGSGLTPRRTLGISQSSNGH